MKPSMSVFMFVVATAYMWLVPQLTQPAGRLRAAAAFGLVNRTQVERISAMDHPEAEKYYGKKRAPIVLVLGKSDKVDVVHYRVFGQGYENDGEITFNTPTVVTAMGCPDVYFSHLVVGKVDVVSDQHNTAIIAKSQNEVIRAGDYVAIVRYGAVIGQAVVEQVETEWCLMRWHQRPQVGDVVMSLQKTVSFDR